MDWQGHLLGQRQLLAFVTDLIWYESVEYLFGRGCWFGVTMVAFGLISAPVAH
jgi:hypothetical protein